MADKAEKLSAQAVVKGLKAYRKPMLTKGPALSDVTAQGAPSGIVDVIGDQ